MLRWGGCCFQMQFSYFACGCALRLYPQRKPALYKVEQRHAVYCDGIVHCVVAGQRDGVHRAVAIDGVALFYFIQGGFSLGI